MLAPSREKWLTVFTHDPKVPWAYVEKDSLGKNDREGSLNRMSNQSLRHGNRVFSAKMVHPVPVARAELRWAGAAGQERVSQGIFDRPYDGHCENKAEDVITVSINLTEKDGALSGMINSSAWRFPPSRAALAAETQSPSSSMRVVRDRSRCTRPGTACGHMDRRRGWRTARREERHKPEGAEKGKS